MTHRTFTSAAVCAVLAAAGLAATGAAAQTPDNNQAVLDNLEAIRTWVTKNEILWRQIGSDAAHESGPEIAFPAGNLSSGAQQMVLTAHKSDEFAQAAQQVSSPFKLLSRYAGVTQSETSTAWCGSNAVVGFNDSSTFLASMLWPKPLPNPSGSLSFNGYAVSTDSGETFSRVKSLVADPLPPRSVNQPGLHKRNLFGDPVIGCTSPNDFYYSSLSLDLQWEYCPGSTSGPASCLNYYPGLTVSISNDGGQTFPKTVAAVRKGDTQSGWYHFLDKEWMAVSQGPQGDVIQVTYTDFDITGFEADLTDPRRTRSCGDGVLDPRGGYRRGPFVRYAIEHVRSTDGGASWSAPAVIEEICLNPWDTTVPDSLVQGSQVRTGQGGEVYVAWEKFSARSPDRPLWDGPRTIRIRRSTDYGATFAPAVNAASITAVGDGFGFQGGFRGFIDFQAMAIDKSDGPTKGAIYVGWQDGRNRETFEDWSYLPPKTGTCPAYAGGGCAYRFADILIARSTDNGATWSAPARVNDDSTRYPVDHFFPSLTVDNGGRVWAAFYDRRRDPRNFLIDTFVASSDDGGRHWSNRRVSKKPFVAVTGAIDGFVNPSYIGDYISIAGESTGDGNGVIAAWGEATRGDQNVSYLKIDSDDEQHGHQGGTVAEERE